MKLLARDVDYSVRALSEMARRKEKVSVLELSEHLKIPRPFLRKILQTLSGHRIVISTKGKGGGFRLGQPTTKIFLKELFRIFHGSSPLGRTSLNCPSCPNFRNCRMRKKICEIEQRVVSELASLSVASLSE